MATWPWTVPSSNRALWQRGCAGAADRHAFLVGSMQPWLHVPVKELARRKRAWEAPERRLTGYLPCYAAGVGPSHERAVWV